MPAEARGGYLSTLELELRVTRWAWVLHKCSLTPEPSPAAQCLFLPFPLDDIFQHQLRGQRKAAPFLFLRLETLYLAHSLVGVLSVSKSCHSSCGFLSPYAVSMLD